MIIYYLCYDVNGQLRCLKNERKISIFFYSRLECFPFTKQIAEGY